MMVKPKIERQKIVVKQMIVLYCSKNHLPRLSKIQGDHHDCRMSMKVDNGAKLDLCEDCGELLEYSHKRLDNCRYGDRKSSCQRCPTHCYSPKMRTRIRDVMRWAGPRMLIYAPKSSIEHLLGDLKHLFRTIFDK